MTSRLVAVAPTSRPTSPSAARPDSRGSSRPMAPASSSAPTRYRNHCPAPIWVNRSTICWAPPSLSDPAPANWIASRACSAHSVTVRARRLVAGAAGGWLVMLWLMLSSSELGGIAVPSAVRAPLAAGHAPWGRPGWTARLWLEKPGGNAGGRLADSRRDDPVAPGSIATGPLSDQAGQAGQVRLLRSAKVLLAGPGDHVQQCRHHRLRSPPRGICETAERLGANDIWVSWVGWKDLKPRAVPPELWPLDADAFHPASSCRSSRRSWRVAGAVLRGRSGGR